MNQIPNIEETNTREVEEIIKEFFDLHFRQTEDGKSVYLCMTSTADDVGDWLAETVHHQLQKAREEFKERIDGFLNGMKAEINISNEYKLGYRQAFLDLKEAYHSELDQAELEGGLEK